MDSQYISNVIENRDKRLIVYGDNRSLNKRVSEPEPFMVGFIFK